MSSRSSVGYRSGYAPHWHLADPQSLPSGHSVGSALVYLARGGVISRQVKGSIAKVYFLSVPCPSLLEGISRLYLRVHYPSDVLEGWAAGSLWSSACTEAARWFRRRGIVESPAVALVLPSSVQSGIRAAIGFGWPDLTKKFPEPTVHPIFRFKTHFSDLEEMRCIVFEESRRPNEVEGWFLGRIGNRMVFQD